MKTHNKNLFLLPALVALLSSIPAGHITAQVFTTLHHFSAYPLVTNLDGASPNGLLLSGNTLYGTAQYGGSSKAGTVFKLNPDGTGFATLHTFVGSDGRQPRGELLLSGNTLYGTTFSGGSSNCGTVFAVQTDGTGFTKLHSFTGWSGAAEPKGPLVLSGNTLYGTAVAAGNSYYGTVFALNTDGTGFTNLHSFASIDGAFPAGGLALSGNVLYGATHGDGSSSYGTVFAINTDGSGFTNLHVSSFSNDAHGMNAGLILSGNTLYGTSDFGGSGLGLGVGAVFAVHTDGTGFTNLYGFTALNNSTNTDGGYPAAALILSGNTLYGTASSGGSAGAGTVFAVQTDGTGFTNLHTFTAVHYPDYINNDGANPGAALVLSNNTLYGTATAGGSSGQGTAFALNTDGTGFTVLHHFTAVTAPATNSDGAGPLAGLITNSSGTVVYGTAVAGGTSGNGTVFAMTSDGTGFTTLHSFSPVTGPFPATNSDGAGPSGGLVLSGSTLYGTAYNGGASGNGTVFAVNTNGTGFITLHSFTSASGANSDGASPLAGLVLSGSTLYGTASQGGGFGAGTVFALPADGSGFTNLHSFTGDDGRNPESALVLSGNSLFGTTTYGGSSAAGTVFALQTDGTGFTNLHSFNYSTEGGNPQAGLILSGNTLYGAAVAGGSSAAGMLFKLNTDGTAFSTLYSYTAPGFNSTNSDGYNAKGLTLSGSTLYGVAYNGGNSGDGTLFGLNTDGTGFTVLHTFPTAFYDGNDAPNAEGANPLGLILSGNALYGTAQYGGNGGNGTVFSLAFRPQLSIASAGTAVILSWPISYAGFSYAGFALQETVGVGSANSWTSVLDTNPPVLVNGQLTVTRPMLGPQWSYRLKHL